MYLGFRKLTFSSWCLQIHYDRVGNDGLFSHKEVTVLFVPDLSECLPSLDAWRDQWLAHKKAVAERERQLSLKKEVCYFLELLFFSFTHAQVLCQKTSNSYTSRRQTQNMCMLLFAYNSAHCLVIVSFLA